jgi:hypothetical protein
MKKVLLIAVAILFAAGSGNAKNLLEKSIYFFNSNTNKMDSAKYWKVFVGQYKGTLERKFPGDEPAKFDCDLNFTLLSSGYVEGYGYTRKGRVDCEAVLLSDTLSADKKIALDSVEYVFNNGQSVKMKNGPVLNLFLDAEGNKIQIHKKLTLTKYRLQIVDEDRNLKPDGDVVVTWFAFKKSAVAEAQKADKAAEAQAGGSN